MTPPVPPILEDAARYAVTPPPSVPLSPALCAVMLPNVLAQRARLARALLAAHPAYTVPRHQRGNGGGA